ncbi:MAG: hypothetical protein LIO76_09140 [Clostridiales bacterium]|nr:hypothetical protein [Clostridiales bacterium]
MRETLHGNAPCTTEKALEKILQRLRCCPYYKSAAAKMSIQDISKEKMKNLKILLKTAKLRKYSASEKDA